MPKYEWLDSSARKENPTIIIGKNILLKIIEDEQKQALLNDPDVKKFVGIYNLPNTELGSIVDEIVDQDEYLDTPLLFRNVISNGKFKARATHLRLIRDLGLFVSSELESAGNPTKT